MKDCEILGYGLYDDKDTGERMFRILIGIRSISDKYKGLMVPKPIYLNYSEELEDKIEEYLNDNSCTLKSYYETTDNILTGTTKVSNIIIK